LEGLCKSWGFYFAAADDSTGTGSNDLSTLITELDDARDFKKALRRLESSPINSDSFIHIQKVAEGRLAQLLLGRFYLLNLFIEAAQDLPKGLNEDFHRKLWVLLQVRPSILGGTPPRDVFRDFAKVLRGISNDDLKKRICSEHVRFRMLLENSLCPPSLQEVPPLICVVDEVQATPSLRLGHFRGSKGDPRPIFREIYLLLSTVLEPSQMRLLLSGTGIRVSELEVVLGSDTLQLAPYRKWKDLGAFDQPELQQQYIKQYIPANWTDPVWEAFLSRAWDWTRGR
jgi:hypothetical protein